MRRFVPYRSGFLKQKKNSSRKGAKELFAYFFFKDAISGCAQFNIIQVFLFCILICNSTTAAAAGYVFDYNSNCNRAYQSYMSLHFADGHGALLNEVTTNPYNLMATYIADYEDCIVLLLNCDKEEYKRREAHMDQRLKLLEQGDHNSPWYRFTKSGVYLHWALVNMRMGDMYHQALYFRKSFLLLKENKKLYPQFEYNAVFSGLQEAVAGSVPDNYKWLAALFGIRGSVRKGTSQLEAFVNTHNAEQPLYAETQLYYLFTRFYLVADQKGVWEYIASSRFANKNNLLHTFVKVNLALDYRKADAAIETLNAAMTEPEYINYPVFDYQMGMALLCKSDTGCTYYFGRYLEKNKSELFIKDAWQKMAFAWYIAGNTAKAEYCKKQITQQGMARIDADKQAEKFGEKNIWPMRKLLQCRYLIEGGYYSQALAVLNSIDKASLTNIADKEEYYFRMGRIYEETGNSSKALEYYQYTITTGKNRHEQFAPRAALQKGRLYEQAGNNQQAMACYKECLAMPEHDFQNSIDNQAKAGLNRVEGK